MTVIDYCQILQDILADQPAFSWADEIPDDPLPTEAEMAARRFNYVEWQETQKRLAAEQAEMAKLQMEQDRLKAEEEEAYEKANEASMLYWATKKCTCTHEMIDSLPMGSEEPCLCYQKVKLDENGEPQECRFFNGPGGCRDGANCIYKHVERNAAEIPCRFEQSAAGCNPGFGRKCPYFHTKVAPAVDYTQIRCRFDGNCNPREGTCPYMHTIMTNRIPRHPNTRSWRV